MVSVCDVFFFTFSPPVVAEAVLELVTDETKNGEALLITCMMFKQHVKEEFNLLKPFKLCFCVELLSVNTL